MAQSYKRAGQWGNALELYEKYLDLVPDGPAAGDCRSQIEQATERRALHLAQVIQLARDYGADGPAGPFPERAAAGRPSASTRRRTAAIAALTATGLAGVAYASRPRRTPKSVWR